MKNKITIISLISLSALLLFNTAFADTTIHLDIESSTGSLFNQDITVAPCDSDNVGTMATTAYCAVLQSGVTSDWSWFGSDAFLKSINTKINNDNNNGIYWGWFANLELGQTALNKYNLSEGDSIIINYDINPLKIVVDNTTPFVGNTIKFTITSFGFDSNWNPAWTPVVGGKIVIGPDTFDLGIDGTYSFIVPNTNPLIVKGQANLFLDTKELTILPNASLDITVPIITLMGDTTESINVGSIYTEKGATATDDIDGDITSKIVLTGNVDTSNAGTYTISFDVSDLSGNKALTVIRTVNVTSGSGGGGGGNPPPVAISLSQALTFLSSKQNINGSYGDMLYTDWAAIALSSVGNQTNDAKSKIMDYLKNNSYLSSSVTDNERHAMALMSLGINPYSGTNINYIDKITSSFDGTQLGDSSLINDDIFGLIVLKNVGYISSDNIIIKDVPYIISHQLSDGSWGGVDMTAAGVQALRNFIDLPDVSNSIIQAESYLISTQGGDGGFGNSFSTSWALQAISKNPLFNTQTINADKYLASKQQTDGGLDPITDPIDNRIWSTAYAIPASLHLSWNSILQSFSKQVPQLVVINNTPVSPVVVPAVKVIEDKVEEVEIIEKEILPLAQIKKINKPKEIVTKVIPISENAESLSASAIGASSPHSLPYRIIRSIIDAILAPFVWLFLSLGF